VGTITGLPPMFTIFAFFSRRLGVGAEIRVDLLPGISNL